jgi:hypothetical protein
MMSAPVNFSKLWSKSITKPKASHLEKPLFKNLDWPDRLTRYPGDSKPKLD